MFTDTDSLLYEIETNVYEDFYMKKDMFDLSEHPGNSRFYDVKKKRN